MQSVDVDATSGESGGHARDEHMHKYVLESSKYPLICFRPQTAFGQLNSASPEVITLDGIFHIQGQDHPLEMQLHVRRTAQPMRPQLISWCPILPGD
jgi:hypothetical protein